MTIATMLAPVEPASLANGSVVISIVRSTLQRVAAPTKGLGDPMYVSPNYRTKSALKAALAAGADVTVFQPFMGSVPSNGKVYLEGPHYPEPHRWYAEGTMEKGKLVKVK